MLNFSIFGYEHLNQTTETQTPPESLVQLETLDVAVRLQQETADGDLPSPVVTSKDLWGPDRRGENLAGRVDDSR